MILIMLHDIIPSLLSMQDRELSLAPDQCLFRQGEAAGALHVVLTGQLNLVRRQEDGSTLILQRPGPGEILAEASLFSAHYHCDGVATTAASVAHIPKRALLGRFRADPDFAEGLTAHLARTVQNARLRSEILSLRTVSARLDTWQGWYGQLPPKGEWRQLADEIGVSPEALYREMAKRQKRVDTTP
ncbi:Crp/Fnr family transcriptional regulator [Kordiimonas marina]|uniref:Crp/Fnr family transcriptional regulator n=1 Tax=Kordiimonas marina TaxID=2872312 RepID=UPI001FF1E0C3|nr:Crp/Fnr family transcriptional regulator [Kordiimonas marina]MCJ9428164.1 Crp/Fnr family transcriptional regulator [Kordiimonas marina]